MVITEKAIYYNKCKELKPNNYYRVHYRITKTLFWKEEYKRLIQDKVHVCELLKNHLGNRVPIEIYYKINSYLNNSI